MVDVKKRIDTLFLLTITFFMAIGEGIRQTGTLGFSLLIIFTIAYTLINGRFSLKTSKYLVYYTLWGLMYIYLSFLDLFPDSWTHFYERELIVRQSYFIFSLYVLVVGSFTFWMNSFKQKSIGYSMALLLVLCLPYSFIQDIFSVNKGNEGAFLLLGGLMNPVMMVFLAGSYFLYTSKKNFSKFIAPLIFILIFISTSNTQTFLVGGMLLILAFSSYYRGIVLGSIILFILVTVAVLIGNYDWVSNDPNIALRKFFWKDALNAVSDTYGIGVGFGSEAITNYYQNMNKLSPYSSFEDEFLTQSIHNSFVYMFFRLGFVGGILFLLFFFKDVMPQEGADQCRHSYFIFFMVFLTIYVNVGVESPMAIIGVSMSIGYILARNNILEQDANKGTLN